MTRRLTIVITLVLAVGIAAAAESSRAIAAEEPAPTPLQQVQDLLANGDYEEAEAGAHERLAVLESNGDANSVEAAELLDVLLESRWRTGLVDEETRGYGLRALEIKEDLLGPRDAGVGKTLHHLAIVAFFNGEYAEAQPLWEQAIEIRQEALGAEHADVAESMNGLANLLQTIGDYATARELYRGAVAIREKVYGPEHPRVAQSLNNFAVLLTETGAYAEALPLGERALAIKRKAVGDEHPQVAVSLVNLADTLEFMGEPERSKALLDQALAIWEKVAGPDDPQVAATLNNLAEQLRRQGLYAEAEPLYRRALTIWESAYGSEHPRIALVLNNLAEVEQATGDLAGALALQERSLAIREAALGPDHPVVANTTQNLAALRMRMGDLDTARALYQRSVAIRRAALGPDHPWVAESLAGLARLEATADHDGAALDAALEAERIGRDHLRLTGRSLAEEQALRYAAVRNTSLDLALTLAARSEDPVARRRVLDSLVRSRAVVLDEMAARHRSVSRATDPAIEGLVAQLAAARARLANLTVRGLGRLEPEVYRELLDRAREDKLAAERALAAASVEYASEQRRSRLGLDDVTQQLPAGSALIALALYDRGTPPESRPSYIAFVLQAGKASPQVVRLGSAEAMDGFVTEWKLEASQGTMSIRRTQAEAETAYRQAGSALRKALWDPLQEPLGDADRVFVVPDGTLNLVSLASLPLEGHEYLIERGPTLHYLSAERDLVPGEQSTGSGTGLLALGAPNYDDTATFSALAPAVDQDESAGGSDGTQADDATLTRSAQCGSFASLRFDPLPAAGREAREIVEIWRSAGEFGAADGAELTYLQGREATEEAFKREAPGRRSLHLATHGFFLGGECSARASGSRGFKVVEEPKAEPGLAGQVSPLLLAGLALAGANHRESAIGSEEDGILTAEEIAGLDLTRVEWAVLSACDTGVGEIRAGEGVFGLRRAMQVAGVRTLIMSLWPVDDEATRSWMQALYEGRLKDGLDSAEAVRHAGLVVLREKREAEGSSHPFYWAAFVAAGDWR